MPTPAQVAAAERMRYPVARQYWAVLRVAGAVRLDGGLHVQGGQGRFAACAGSAGSQEKYAIVALVAADDPRAPTARLLAAVAAFERDLTHAGWGAFGRDAADRRYLTATKGTNSLSLFDVASGFDTVPPPTTVQFVVSGPCVNLGILAPNLHDVDAVAPTPAPLPPLKVG
jgi:hypothetical protein